MAKRGPQPKTGKMEPPAYTLCGTVPEPPTWLSDIGREEWMEKAEELRARATLSTVCLPMLALYFIREHGSSYTNEKGWQAPRPEVSLQTQKAKLMLILAKEFGFTPGSQSRIASLM